MKSQLPSLLLSILLVACSTPSKESGKTVETPQTKVELTTTLGKVVLVLYNETPQHRDNFISLVKEGAYDSLMFHRVINDFVIQAGDPESKFASPTDTLGNGDRDYRVPAEINPLYFHKRGALGAARDGNPERASSSMQFYIVQRGPRADSLIDKDQTRINGWLAQYYALNAPENNVLKDSILKAMENEDFDTYNALNDTLKYLAESFEFQEYIIPEKHRETYRSVGGTPHLDQNYTVFGEVLSGMEVVDSIANVPINDLNRPVQDIRILSAKIID